MFYNKRKLSELPANGIVKDFPESLVNPLYKPKTLAEMRAEMRHTGINPAPASLRDPLPVSDGVDPMDAPPIPVTGDRFEHIRRATAIKSNLESELKSLKPIEQPKQDPPPADPVE